MEKVHVFVGLDYHSKSIQVCAVDPSGRVLLNRKCGNSVAEVTELVAPLGEVRRAAVESCCGAADLAEALIRDAGWNISLAHPGYVSRMKANPDKTDYSDARMLAELCRVGFLPPVWLAPAAVRDLRSLVRYRCQQVDRQRQAKVRVLSLLREHRIPEPPLGRWCVAYMQWLKDEPLITGHARWIIDRHLRTLTAAKTELRAVEKRLKETTADDALVNKLLAIVGVGPVTAWTMRAMIGRFDRFSSGKQLARFCALTPRNSSSGERVADAGLVKAGDPSLKTVLIQAAHRLQRHDRRWAELAGQLRGRGKPAGVATAAVANRWVRWMWHQLKEVPMAA